MRRPTRIRNLPGDDLQRGRGVREGRRPKASPSPPHKVNEHVCNEPSKYNRRKCDQGEVDYLLWRFSGQIARRNIVQLDAKSQSFATGQPPKTIAEVRLRIDDHNA